MRENLLYTKRNITFGENLEFIQIKSQSKRGFIKWKMKYNDKRVKSYLHKKYTKEIIKK